jgi:hypothetical protein
MSKGPVTGMETSDEKEHVNNKEIRKICEYPGKDTRTGYCRTIGGDCMTRGRPPRQAIREARAIAEKFGIVVEVPCCRGSPADLMIFCTRGIFFVRVKRTRSDISDIIETVKKYKKDLLWLCTITITNVVFREIWVRSPRGSWQYFRILEDGIMVIRNSGHFDRPSSDFGHSAWPPDPETEFNRDPCVSSGSM